MIIYEVTQSLIPFKASKNQTQRPEYVILKWCSFLQGPVSCFHPSLVTLNWQVLNTDRPIAVNGGLSRHPYCVSADWIAARPSALEQQTREKSTSIALSFHWGRVLVPGSIKPCWGRELKQWELWVYTEVHSDNRTSVCVCAWAS